MSKTETLKRTERVAAAVYLITGFFSDQEPLKWKLRTLASDLVSHSFAIKDKYQTAQELTSLFSVAKTAGLISDMNHDILAQELAKFEPEADKPLELPPIVEPREPERSLPQLETRSQIIKDKSDEAPSFREFSPVAVKKNTRQSVIVSLLKKRKEIMIKDVAPLIDGVSEKTIQRELLSMVKAGILKKTGEKRWSRYTLASQQ